jgi:hypothetical protein
LFKHRITFQKDYTEKNRALPSIEVLLIGQWMHKDGHENTKMTTQSSDEPAIPKGDATPITS